MPGTLKLKSDAGGSISLAANTTAATDLTVTVPDATGTVMVSGNMPAFSAYLSASQTVSSATNTKIQFNTKLFDTNNCYDNSTNYRFTPTVAGYYQVCISLSTNPASTATVININKNGSAIQSFITQANNGITCIWNLSYIVSMNGSTDYLEFYGQCNGATSFVGGLGNSSVQVAMVRAA
jgi:hypothetical protein